MGWEEGVAGLGVGLEGRLFVVGDGDICLAVVG